MNVLAVCLLGATLTAGEPNQSAPAASHTLPRSSPEEQGVSPLAIRAFIEAADSQIDTMNSVMILRHGKVVAEGWWAPYDAQTPHMMYSLSKSFTSTAVGLAISENKLSLDDTVVSFFPDSVPADASANLKSMRVRDLLRMATGHQNEVTIFGTTGSWIKAFLAHPVPFKPGTHFLYNTPGTYMLSAIVQKQTGQTVLDYLKPRLFDPLGIANPTWGTSPEGVSLGGTGLNIRTEDIARFGQLYLQHGKWEGKQLVPAEWIAAATSLQVANGSNPASDWDQGYGFQFWRARHNAYRGDGAFGQYCLVLPEQDAVIAITSGCKDMQAVMNLIWDKLLPGMSAAPLAADPVGSGSLRTLLGGLRVKLPEGSPTSPLASRISGKRIVFPSNARGLNAIRIEFGNDGATLLSDSDHGESRIAIGSGGWLKGTAAFPTGRDSEATEQPVGVAGAWKSDDTYVVKVCQYATPFYSTHVFHFNGDKVTYESEANVAFGPTRAPTLEGTIEAEK